MHLPARARSHYVVVAHLASAALLCPAVANAATAAAYPSKPVRIIVPYTPGGGVGLIGRVVADELSKPLGQSVIVDHRPGGSTVIGADAVARSAPDGYTLLVTSHTTH